MVPAPDYRRTREPRGYFLCRLLEFGFQSSRSSGSKGEGLGLVISRYEWKGLETENFPHSLPPVCSGIYSPPTEATTVRRPGMYWV